MCASTTMPFLYREQPWMWEHAAYARAGARTASSPAQPPICRQEALHAGRARPGKMPVQKKPGQKNQGCARHARQIQARSHSHADARRRGQSADVLSTHEDHARAQKARAGHDLGRDTRGVKRHVLRASMSAKPYRDDHKQRRLHGNRQVGANAPPPCGGWPVHSR